MSTLMRFDRARETLSAFVIAQGEGVAAMRSWAAVDEDPKFDLAAMRWAWVSPEPFPIWGGACNRTIYTQPYVNLYFRLWHDWLHVSYGLGLTFHDEMVVSALHVDSAFNRGSDAAKLMWLDTAGQTLYHKQHGHFPEDQLAWAWDEFSKM